MAQEKKFSEFSGGAVARQMPNGRLRPRTTQEDAQAARVAAIRQQPLPPDMRSGRRVG